MKKVPIKQILESIKREYNASAQHEKQAYLQSIRPSQLLPQKQYTTTRQHG